MKSLLQQAPRYLFFTGKGGVGKTSLSCLAAVTLANQGRNVLLISTDPASNLDEVLETPLGTVPTAVCGQAHLDAMNIDPDAAAEAYRERILAPYRQELPASAIRSIEEQLSGACTVEIASFNEFTRIVGDDAVTQKYEHIILDTAPTGHTLRLLGLPAAWNDFIAENKTGNSCLGPLSGLKDQRELYHKVKTRLGDAASTLLVLVARGDSASLAEADRASRELASLGMNNQFLLINGVFKATDPSDPLAAAFEKRIRDALHNMPAELAKYPTGNVPFHPKGFVGLDSLQNAFEEITIQASPPPPSHPMESYGSESMTGLVDTLASKGKGVVMTMGKGGVGKTTIAAAIALNLAERGYPVHLSTTDPAAHLDGLFDHAPPNLEITRIDPKKETQEHIQHVMDTAGADLDEEGKELLLEELKSPCTEEIAVFQAFARTVAHGTNQFVILDTAPTGHTLLLLDASEEYHREVLKKNSGDMPEPIRELLPRLRDPDFTHIIITALPGPTPIHEAERLQEDLMRAGIHPFAWIINQSMAASETNDPLLRIQGASEQPYIREVMQKRPRTVVLPWLKDPPKGTTGLDQIFKDATPVRVG